MPQLVAQKTVQQVYLRQPPVRGLNTVDPVALMPPTDALEMDNFISSDKGLALRAGWYDYAVHIGGDATHTIRTVLSFDDTTASSLAPPLSQSELFAVTDQGIYLIEGGGDMAAKTADLALTGNQYAGRLSSVQFAAVGANYLVACSETDGALLYDGVTWKKFAPTGTGPGTMTGVNPANLVQVVSWKKRLGFVERNTGTSWWLDVGQVGGIAKPLDFGPQFVHGGALLALINWTQDAGEGVDDYLVAFSTAGDLAVYKGTDPVNIDAAAMPLIAESGIWYIGQPPVGRRCFTQTGGNIYFLTEFGIIPIAQIVQGGLDNVLMAGTDESKQLRKLQELLNRDFETSINTAGWELIRIPNQALLHIARPALSVTENIQYAFNLHTLAWSRLLDVPGVTFYHRLGETYAGTNDGRVLRVFDGATDRMGVDGKGAQEIRGLITPAFDYFDNPPATKRALMVRANFQAAQRPTYAVLMNADLYISSIPNWPASRTAGGSLWDASMWDKAIWGGGIGSWAEWRSVNAMGKSLAPTIFVASSQPVVLASLSYMIQPGGAL